eukprot:GHVN01082066.1.p1 GENE.GHVN01082066.1~~GHVN01082066.1.p1  ORF type:complete len:257 (+),score=50.80 GHVN01082066.1:100-870(+)
MGGDGVCLCSGERCLNHLTNLTNFFSHFSTHPRFQRTQRKWSATWSRLGSMREELVMVEKDYILTKVTGPAALVIFPKEIKPADPTKSILTKQAFQRPGLPIEFEEAMEMLAQRFGNQSPPESTNDGLGDENSLIDTALVSLVSFPEDVEDTPDSTSATDLTTQQVRGVADVTEELIGEPRHSPHCPEKLPGLVGVVGETAAPPKNTPPEKAKALRWVDHSIQTRSLVQEYTPPRVDPWSKYKKTHTVRRVTEANE